MNLRRAAQLRGALVLSLLFSTQASASEQGPDQAQDSLRAQLEQVLQGQAPEGKALDDLFHAPLDDLEALGKRLVELEQEAQALKSAPSAEPAQSDPAPPAKPEILQREPPPRPTPPSGNGRAQIIELRRKYLSGLAGRLNAMGEAARQSLAGMKAPRQALRDKAQAIAALEQSMKGLSRRIRALRLRSDSGALLGFASQRQNLSQDLLELQRGLRESRQELMTQGKSLLATAEAIEEEARSLRRSVLLKLEDRDEMDRLFLQHLENLRRMAKQASGPLPPLNFHEFGEKVTAALPEPERLASTAEAAEHLSRIRSLADELDRLRGQLPLLTQRWHLAFEREALTLLTPLARPETVQSAYSLSTEYLQDLLGDFRLVSSELRDWAGQRWYDLTHSTQWLHSQAGAAFLLRLAAALLLIIGVVLLRRRIGSLPSTLIRRLKGLRFFARRIGTLVRWAGFLQAVLPTAALMVVAYVAMALVGFNYPEVRIFEVAFFWILLYLLGRQVLLGLTRQVSRGRPALIAVEAETVALLRLTYGRLGLVMALAFIAGTWSRDWLGTGSLSVLVSWLVWIWLVGWLLWGAFAWRPTLAAAWQRAVDEEGPQAKLAGWMATHRAGALLSPLSLIWLVFLHVLGLARRALAGGGVISYFRARSLKRMARRGDDPAAAAPSELPERYLKEFPLYPIQGDEGTVLLERDKQLNQVLGQLQAWKANRTEASLVLLGEKGAGKTTFLSLVERSIKSFPVVRHTISRKLLSEKALLEELAPVLGAAEAGNLGVLTAHLNKQEEQVVLLDEVHNLFLRTVDGYQAYDALVRLVNYTSEHVFWVLGFNSFAWNFLNDSRKRTHYFRRLLPLPEWSTAELQDLVAKRTKRAGMKLLFDEMLLDDDKGVGDFQLVENAEGYFRLLRDASSGNPRVATWLWLRSLRPEGEDSLRVGLLRQPKLEAAMGLEDDLLFALSAVCQHENLSVDELRQVLNCSLDFAGFAVRYLSESGFFEPKHTDPRRITLSARSYTQVIKMLRSKHLLTRKE